ncbi:unnamed protein product [Meloidogyne enterolobii]
MKKDTVPIKYEYVLKLRGITLNHDVTVNQGLQYENFKERVIKYAKDSDLDPIPVNYSNFLRPSIPKGTITSVPMTKVYKPYVGKGIISPQDFRVLDFGYTK